MDSKTFLAHSTFHLTILEVINKPLQGMILTWDTPMKDFFFLRARCNMPTLFVNIHSNKNFIPST